MQASSSTPPSRPPSKAMAQTAGDSPHCICASLAISAGASSPFRLNSPAQLAVASPLAIRVALTAVTPPPAAASPIPIEPRSASCPPAVRFLPPAVRRLQEEQRTRRLEQEPRFADERARLRRAAGSPLKRGGGSPLRNVTTFTVLLDEPPEAVGDSDGGDDDDEVDDSSPPCSFSPTGSPPESTGILFRPKAVSPKASRKSDEMPPPVAR